MDRIHRRHALKLFGTATALGLGRPAFARQRSAEHASRHKFVLIHGAWHGSFAWDGVASRLRQRGHEVEAPTLPGMHPDDNQVGIRFSDYVEAVVEVLRRQHRPVILVGHSSAGMLLQAAVTSSLRRSRWKSTRKGNSSAVYSAACPVLRGAVGESPSVYSRAGGVGEPAFLPRRQHVRLSHKNGEDLW